MLLTFRVQIAHITKPPVWRKLVVPGNFSFDDFHRVIQIAFGWEGYHPYQFSEKGDKAELFIGEPSVYSWIEIRDSLKMKLSQVFQKKGQKFIYTYDSGDNWKHIITLEAITDDKSKFADCIDGKGNCPPEDCGGPWGYEGLKLIVTDPQNKKYISIREFFGMDIDKEFDPVFFDLEATRKLVRSI